MNVPISQSVYAVSSGTTGTGPFIPVIDSRDPTSQDTNYPTTKWWINSTTNALFYLNGFDSSTGQVLANWQALGSSSSGSITVTGAGGIQVTGSPVASGGTLALENINIPNSALDPIANSALVNSTIGINAGTGVVVSSSPVSLGGSTTVSVNNIPNSALQTIQNSALANSSINVVGGSGITVSGSPVSLGGSVTISTGVASTNPAFHAYLTTSQVYPQGNPVPFDATDINVGGFYSTSAFSATAPVKGFYSFVVHIGISSSSTNFSLTLNNTTTGVAYQTQNCSALATRNSSGFLSISSAFLIPCNANDVLNVTVVNSPNGTLAGIQGLVQFTTFAGVLISSLP